MDAHLEGMAVQPRAFVAFRYMGQAMGGFNGEFFVDFHRYLGSNLGRKQAFAKVVRRAF
jgi:hypothetical protein